MIAFEKGLKGKKMGLNLDTQRSGGEGGPFDFGQGLGNNGREHCCR